MKRRKPDEAVHVIRVLDRTGDTTTTWRPSYKVEVKQAETVFKEMAGKGYAMFAVAEPKAKPIQIREFDPEAHEIIAVPQLKGG